MDPLPNENIGVARSPYPSKPYQSIADLVAEKGRYGDTMLMHVNPGEVDALSKQYPGMITINPETGQPEAFLGAILMALKAALAAIGPGITAGLTALQVPAGLSAGLHATLSASIYLRIDITEVIFTI